MQERREFARVEDDAIRFRWPGSRRDEPVANLSRSGAKLFTVRSAPVGSLVELELLREGAEPLPLLATVRRVERPTRSDRETSLGMSVEFCDLDQERGSVLVRWTGDANEPVKPVKDPEPSEAPMVGSPAADHRGKLWEDPQPGEGEAPTEESSEDGRTFLTPGSEPDPAVSAPTSAAPEASVSEVDSDSDPESADPRIQDLEARLMRAESLAAEALVQLARAERRVEQLEAQSSAVEPPDSGSRPYAGGDDGSSILEDPLVAELFSRPVAELAAPRNEAGPGTEDERAPAATSTTPAIEMIERVEQVERRSSRANDRQAQEDRPSATQDDETQEATGEAGGREAASKGPISGAVAAFHRLADDPLKTVGFSRSELLEEIRTAGEGTAPEGAVPVAPSEPAGTTPGAESGTESASPDETVEEESERDWEGRESLALEVSEEDVFVEVIGLDEDGGSSPGVPEDASSGEDSSDPVRERDSGLETAGPWPDLEIEESSEEGESTAPGAVAAAEAITAEPAHEEVEKWEEAELDAPGTVVGAKDDGGEEASSRVPDPDREGSVGRPAVAEGTAAGSEDSDVSAFEEAGLAGDDASAFETDQPGPEQAETGTRDTGPVASTQSEDESASAETSSAHEIRSPRGAAAAEAGAEDAGAENAAAEDVSPADTVDEEIESVISAAMVEEIRPPAPSPDTTSTAAPSDDAAEEDARQQEPGRHSRQGEDADDSGRSRELTLSDLPTCSEMVKAMGSGRIVKTPRFDRLEPVSRLDIEISDLLRGCDRLEEMEAKTKGRISPAALHRVLFVFFERGLVAVEPES